MRRSYPIANPGGNVRNGGFGTTSVGAHKSIQLASSLTPGYLRTVDGALHAQSTIDDAASTIEKLSGLNHQVN